MRIFATDPVVAKSRFWYFLRQLRKFKKTTGEIVSVQEIKEKKPLKIKEWPKIFRLKFLDFSFSNPYY
jgi:large subunit ribosomal protein L18Ae